MDFIEALVDTLFEHPEIIKEYDRLYGANVHKILSTRLGAKERSPIEAAVDRACGYVEKIKELSEEEKKELAGFAAFFYDCVWSRLPDEAFVNQDIELPPGWTLTKPEPHHNGGYEATAIREGGHVIRTGVGTTPEEATAEAIRCAWDELWLCSVTDHGG
jgi:hypothetical protein